MCHVKKKAHYRSRVCRIVSEWIACWQTHWSFDRREEGYAKCSILDVGKLDMQSFHVSLIPVTLCRLRYSKNKLDYK